MGFSGTLILLLPVPGEHPGAAAPPIGGPPGEPQREKTGATWGEQVRVSSRPLLPLLRLLHPALPPLVPESARPAPRLLYHHSSSTAPCLQDLGSCKDKAKKLDTQIRPQRSLMAGGPQRSDPSVCLLLSGQSRAWSRVDSGPCSSPGPAKPGNHVTAKKCNWPLAQYWGVWGIPQTPGSLRESEEIIAQR